MIMKIFILLNLFYLIYTLNSTTETIISTTTEYDPCTLCKNQAYCKRESNNKVTCYCVPGYTGRYCDRDINECLSNPCSTNSTCLNLVNEYKCLCNEGYTGLNCDIKIITGCDSKPCKNNGICLNLPNGSYSCNCPSGYTGQNCSIEIDECESQPCNSNNTLKCINLIDSYKCECKHGFSGVECNEKLNKCASNKDFCLNNSTCIDLEDGFKCKCGEGFEGKRCDVIINECIEKRPCLNNATCNPLFNGYRCNCMTGFKGQNCEINIDECESLPCGSNGHCLDLINDFKCICKQGYTGQTCDQNLNECDENPCHNGAKCTDLDIIKQSNQYGYMCDCSTVKSNYSYIGQNCSIRLDLCEQDEIKVQCKNYASCETIYNELEQKQDFNCICRDGFTGKYCELETIIHLDSSYYLEHSLIQSEEHEPFKIKFDFKTIIDDYQKSPLLVLYLDKFNLELVLNRYFIEINKYYKDLGFNQTLMPFLNNDLTHPWHSIEVSVKDNIIIIKYSNENITYDYSFTYKEQPPITFYNFYRAIIITIGKYYIPQFTKQDEFDIEQLNEKYFEGCVKNIQLNENQYLFLNNQSIKYGCKQEKTKCSCEYGASCVSSLVDNNCNNCEEPFYGPNCGKKLSNLIFNKDESLLSMRLKQTLSLIQTSFIFNYDLYNDINLIQFENENVDVRVGLREQKLFIEQVDKDTNNSLVSIDNLNAELIEPNKENRIEIIIDSNRQLVLIKLNKKTKIKINKIKIPNDLTKIKIGSRFYGKINSISLNGDYIDPLIDHSNSYLIIDKAQCLNESCNQICTQFSSKKCQSLPNSINNLVYNFQFKPNDTLKSISFDINMRQFISSIENLIPIFNFTQENTNIIEFSLKKHNFSDFFMLNNNLSIMTHSTRNETNTYLKRVKLIVAKNGSIDIKINGLKFASSLELKYNLSEYENYVFSLKIGEICLSNIQINNILMKTDENKQFKYFNLINSNCKKPKMNELTPKSSVSKYTYLCDEIDACSSNATECINQLSFRFNKKTRLHQVDYSFKCECFGNECKNSINASYNQSVCLTGVYCLNGGFCTDHSSLKCTCDREYRGDRCEIYDPCSAEICSTNSECRVMNNKTYLCDCHPGYIGQYCQYKLDETCFNKNICLNNGTCVDLITSNSEKAFKCECANGFYGENCENKIDRCENERPCKNGGICVTRHDLEVGYECRCPSEWTGFNCEHDFDECSSETTNKCSKFSICVNKFPSYECICKNKFTYGRYCQFESICRFNPCGYHGKCVPLFNLNDENSKNENSYKCKCNHGYSGVNCTLETCELNLCLHGSRCFDDNKTVQFKCNCEGTGYAGRLCEFKLETTTTTQEIISTSTDLVITNEQIDDGKSFKIEIDNNSQPSLNMKTSPPKEYMYHFILWPLMGLMVGLLIILGMIFIMKTKKSRATRGTYSPSRHEQNCSRIEFTMDLKRPPEERLI